MPIYDVRISLDIQFKLEAPDAETAERAAQRLSRDSSALRDFYETEDFNVHVSPPRPRARPDHGVDAFSNVVHIQDARDLGTARDVATLEADIAAATL